MGSSQSDGYNDEIVDFRLVLYLLGTLSLKVSNGAQAGVSRVGLTNDKGSVFTTVPGFYSEIVYDRYTVPMLYAEVVSNSGKSSDHSHSAVGSVGTSDASEQLR